MRQGGRFVMALRRDSRSEAAESVHNRLFRVGARGLAFVTITALNRSGDWTEFSGMTLGGKEPQTETSFVATVRQILGFRLSVCGPMGICVR